MKHTTHTSRKRSPSYRMPRRTPLSQPCASGLRGDLARCLLPAVPALLALVAALGLATACIVDVDRPDPKPVPGARGSVTFVVSTPRAAGSALTRADEADHATTRAIDEGSQEDNRIDELVIVRFDRSGEYVDHILVGGDGPGEPTLTPDAGDPTGQRWSFTLEGLEDGEYRAVVFANSRDQVLAHIDAHDTDANSPDPTKLTIDGLRATLRTGHTISAATPWNADPDDATDDENGVYCPFPMSSQPVDFSVPGARDFSTWPIDLVRPLAKINIRIGEALRTTAGRYQIEQVVVRNLNSDGRLMPAANFYGNAELLDDGAVNEQPGRIATLEYTFTPGWEVKDEIFVWEQQADHNPITEPDWGRDEFCVLVKLGPFTIEGTGGSSHEMESGAWFRIDLLGSLEADPANRVRVNLLRNHTYGIEITAINTTGYSQPDEAYANPPHGVEFSIDARDNGEGDEGMNDNTYNGVYQLTTDRSVLIVGPRAGDQATVMVYTDYEGGFRRSTGGGFVSGEPEIAVSRPESWPRAEQPVPLTYTVPADYTGSMIRIHRPTIFAGELHKTLTIVQLPDPARATGTSDAVTDYVGAFWRADQRGERLIGLKPNVKWAAFVLGGDDWVVMDAKPSRDTRVRTSNPEANGNDADFERNHNVESTVGWAAGTTGPAGGYFRIGLRSSHAATPDVPARYATVMVVEGSFPLRATTAGMGSPRLLYLRQGHEADYLMRPDEPTGNGNMSSRPMARRFSPYNLTAAAFKLDPELESANVGPQTSNNYSGTFVDYPTQVGGLFRWAHPAGVIAWSPKNTVNNEWIIQDPVGSERGVWSDLAIDHESCPPGYRRPADGPEWEFSPTQNRTVHESELFQSLLLNVVTGSNAGNETNSVFGSYADGFFDRRQTVDIGVSTGNSAVAYIGHLFFNRASGSSLFLPASGFLDHMNENARRNQFGGHHGRYWTSFSGYSGSYNTNGMLSTTSTTVQRAYGVRDDASAIRCVKEPDHEPRPGLALAPPGVIGIRHSELSKPADRRRLTIRGSSTYKGTDVERYIAGGAEFEGMGGLEPEPVYVVYFKWGSTVGILGGPDGDQYDAAGDLAWVHPDYSDGTDWNNMTTGGHTDRSDGYNIPVDYSPESLARGWGDPCDLVGDHTPDNPSGWKTPTGAPWTYSDGYRTSTPFGTGLDKPWSDPTVVTRWKNIVAGGKTVGGAGTDNGRVWLIAAGFREPGGRMAKNNTNGDYWAATVYENGGDYYKSELGFDHDKVSGAGRLFVYLDYAMPVRCVKPNAPTIPAAE